MLGILISTVSYLGLAWAMVVVIAPYILRFSDERVLVYASIVTAIGIIATLVAIHFLVEFIVTWFIGFYFSDLFSMKTVVVFIFGYFILKTMNHPVGKSNFV
jgi:hypothetical protein